MPNFDSGATINQSKVASIQLIDASGDKSTAALNDIDIAATQTQIDAYFDALSEMSNAGVISNTSALTREVSIPSVIAFDEALSSVTNTANFTFQDEALNVRSLVVPAPDLSIFQGDGVNVDLTNTLVVAFVDAAKAVLNAGTPAGTYEIVRGTRGDRRRQRGNRRSRPQITEPGVGDLPPDAPAT